MEAGRLWLLTLRHRDTIKLHVTVTQIHFLVRNRDSRLEYSTGADTILTVDR